MVSKVDIQLSRGRGKSGKVWAYIRPAEKCFNRSRRVPVELIDTCIENHFSVVNYYDVDGFRIGAKDESAALKEYWRVCEKHKIGRQFDVKPETL